MAEKKFLVDLNLSGNKAKNFRLEDYADNTAPTSNFVGRMIYTTNSTNPDRVEVYNGSAWKTFAFTDDVPSVSITLTAPDLFAVSGSPAAYNGTLDFEWNTVAVNRVLAGPGTGSTAAIPTFRSLVAADIPDLSSTYLTTSTASSTYAPINNPVFTGTVTLPTSLVFEGATTDEYETTLTVTDPTADRTITLPNASGTVALLGTIALGTDTTGNYVSEISPGTGIGVSHTPGEGSTATITNNGVVSIAGTTGEISITEGTGSGPYTGAVKVGLPTNVVIAGDLKIGGDLDIIGAINSFSTTTVSVEDNKFLLNSNVTGTPTLDAGIEVERGDYTNASLYWNETANGWYVGTPGDSGSAATVTALSLAGHTHATSDILLLQEFVEDTISTSLTDSGTIDFSYTDNSTSAGTITAAVILAASNPYLSTASGLAVDVSALETKLTTDGYTKKYSTTIGDGTAQTFTVTHSLSTRAVTVSVFESTTPWAEVEAEVLHTSTSAITINTNSVPTEGQYTVVVVG
jgi:hypothetical protein